MKILVQLSFLMIVVFAGHTAKAEINVKKIQGDLSKDYTSEDLWKSAEADQNVLLMAQPMVAPRPTSTETNNVKVAAIHDGKWVVFRVKWTDAEPSESTKLATFSDAVALQFPAIESDPPPPVMMGTKGAPVQIFHWRYSYQLDKEQGKKSIEQIYPNMTVDMYPLEYKEKGNYKKATEEQKEAFVGGTAAGNPQSFPKTGVDEILAEGFGSSALIEGTEAVGKGNWKNKEWTVYIARPLTSKGGSKLVPGQKNNVAFAVWQGGKNEVGSRKAVTMMWTPVVIQGN